MRFFALFDDQTFCPLNFRFARVDQSENIDLVQIKCFSDDISVKNSAEKGIWAAHDIMERMEIIPTGKKYYVLCEFEGKGLENSITGESAGLAFVLKFAAEILHKEKNRKLDFSIAATGEISKHSRDAEVQKVEAINPKFTAALNCLKSGDCFFYPTKNETDIDPILKKKLKQARIRIYPISTVEDSVRILNDLSTQDEPFSENFRENKQEPFQDGNIHKENRVKATSSKKTFFYQRKILFSFLFLILISTFLFYLIFQNQLSSYDQVLNKLEYGNFEEIKNLTENYCNPENTDAQMEELCQQITASLNLAVEMEYLKQGGNLMNPGDVLLGVNDGYKFKINPEKKCFVYLFQFDSNFGVELLFPLTSFSVQEHLIKSDSTYFIPGKDTYFYLTDDKHHGKIIFYILASYWRAKDVEEAFTKYQLAETDKKNVYREKLLDRILLRLNTSQFGIQSIYLNKESFLQE